jgi:hypothetical protein
MKLLSTSGSAGDTGRYRRFVGGRAAADVDDEPCVRDLDAAGRALAVASAQSATSKDGFIESNRAVDVGDDETICEREPLPRRHLKVFLLALHFVHCRLQFKRSARTCALRSHPRTASAAHDEVDFTARRASTVRELRLALPNLDKVTVRIADVAARLAILVLRLRDERGSSTPP